MKDLPLNNKDLLHRVAADTRGSFERFYHLYYTQVFRFAYYFLKDKDASREVVTDVFFAVWKSRRKLKEIANIETYLYIVVRNEAARYAAKQTATTSLPLDELPQSPDIGESESPEEKLLKVFLYSSYYQQDKDCKKKTSQPTKNSLPIHDLVFQPFLKTLCNPLPSFHFLPPFPFKIKILKILHKPGSYY